MRANSFHVYTLPDEFKVPFAGDVEKAKRFLRHLQDNDASFHLDDVRELTDDYVTDGEAPCGGPNYLFAEDEQDLVRHRVDELWDLDWGQHECPHGYMIDYLHELNGDWWELGMTEVSCLGREDQQVCVVHRRGPSGRIAVVLDFTGNRQRFHTLTRTLDRPDPHVYVLDGRWSYDTVEQALEALDRHGC